MGSFRAHRAEANRLNREVPEWLLRARALVLSHAHLDHSGNLPTAVRRGYAGDIFCTPATRDLCSVMLRDAALLQVGSGVVDAGFAWGAAGCANSAG